MTVPPGKNDPPIPIPAEGPDASVDGGPTHPAEVLAERLAVDLAEAWRAGRRLAVEELLDAYPLVREHPHAAVRLIYEEICLRQELRVGGASAEVLARFPRYRDELSILLEGHRLLAPDVDAPAFPKVGEVFEGATLLAELGRGGAGRVYLATQPDLADRPVVLKVTPDSGAEHLALARLQHTYIVPLYSARVLPETDLRVLCMPYLGHATFARVLGALRGRPPRSRTGSDVVRVIEEAQAQSAIPLPVRGPGVRWLARASYEQAICWVGACLAEGLHYAHQRGLVHLDVKPSNVLVAADGTPMLLDFHLARGPILPDELSPERIGGTLAYMSPEQAAALDDARAGRRLVAGVDERSDIYSLALILYEALGGALHDASDATARRLRRANPGISPSLVAVLARCLARDPRRRYPDAVALAEDLRRHLADRPLAGVANRNLTERWRKWRRRRPHALPLTAMALAVLLAVSLAATSTVHRWTQRARDAEATLSRLEKERGASPAAVAELEQALARVRGIPGGGALARRLAAEVRVARRAVAADRLGRVLDRLRFEEAADVPDRAEGRALLALCRDVWAGRGLFLEPIDRPLPADLDRQVREDLLDLAILSAALAITTTPAEDGPSARREAWRRLDEAEAAFGPSAGLERQRAALADADGLKDLARACEARAASQPTRSAWDDYRRGVSLLRAGDLGRAAEMLARACRSHPDAFWPNYHRGLCAERASRPLDAVEAFSTCIAARPRAVAGYAHRARAWQALGRADRAGDDLDRAVELDPRLASSWTNRGVFLLRAGRPLEAIADLRRALDAGGDPATVHYNLALAYRALRDRTAARSHVRAALAHDSGHVASRGLLAELLQD